MLTRAGFVLVFALAGCNIGPEWRWDDCSGSCSPSFQECRRGKLCTGWFGDSAPYCQDDGPESDGTSCGGGAGVCRGGSCDLCTGKADGAACGAYFACKGQQCQSICVDAAEGTACGTNLACHAGTCADLCASAAEGTACGTYLACHAGTCTDMCVSAADGTACGAYLACHAGACGDVCASAADGTACGVDEVCHGGTCESTFQPVTFRWNFRDALGNVVGDWTAASPGCAAAGVDFVNVMSLMLPCVGGDGIPGTTLSLPVGVQHQELDFLGPDNDVRLRWEGDVTVPYSAAQFDVTLSPAATLEDALWRYTFDGARPTDCAVRGMVWRITTTDGRVVADSAGTGFHTIAPGVIDRCTVAGFDWQRTGGLQQLPWDVYVLDYLAAVNVAPDGSVVPVYEACSAPLPHLGFVPTIPLVSGTARCF